MKSEAHLNMYFIKLVNNNLWIVNDEKEKKKSMTIIEFRLRNSKPDLNFY